VTTSPDWEELSKALQAVAGATQAFNAYVLDSEDTALCSARWFAQVYSDDLANLVRVAGERKTTPPSTRGSLDLFLFHQNCHAYLRAYGSRFVLVLRFPGPCDQHLVRQIVASALPLLELLTICLVPDSREWFELRKALEALASTTDASNAYVLDAWDRTWCFARSPKRACSGDLAAVVHAAVARRGTPLRRCGKLDVFVADVGGYAYLRTYGSCYVVMVTFAAAFDDVRIRDAVTAALPRLELLTTSIPPPDGPWSGGNEAVRSA